jgi:hypothetical protein
MIAATIPRKRKGSADVIPTSGKSDRCELLAVSMTEQGQVEASAANHVAVDLLPGSPIKVANEGAKALSQRAAPRLHARLAPSQTLSNAG